MKKTTDRLKQREKQIVKDAFQAELEVQQFQLQKQAALNLIGIVVPLKLSQMYTFEGSGSFTGPTDGSHPLVHEDNDHHSIPHNNGGGGGGGGGGGVDKDNQHHDHNNKHVTIVSTNMENVDGLVVGGVTGVGETPGNQIATLKDSESRVVVSDIDLYSHVLCSQRYSVDFNVYLLLFIYDSFFV